MSEPQQDYLEVRSVLIPLSGMNLLLPNAVVLEVVDFRAPVPYPDEKPDWLLGTMSWRQSFIPVISIDRILGKAIDNLTHRVRIAVCHSFTNDSKTPFIGIVTQGIPRLVRANNDTLTLLESDSLDASELLISHVRVGEEEAFIASMDGIGKILVEAL